MWRKAHACALAAAVLLLAACHDDDVTGASQQPGSRTQELNQDNTGDAPAVRRISLDIRASGAFRPGAPIAITSTARARHDASEVDFTLAVLDDDDAVVGGGAGRAVGSSRGALARGASRQLAATVTFAQPGYYRVVATTASRPPSGQTNVAGDTATIEESSETLYILVDDTGGRLTQGYDPAAAGGRTTKFGTFGPFVGTRARTAAGPSAQLSPDGPRAVVTSTRGAFWYYNRDSQSYRPVPNALVSVSCLNSSFAVVSTLTTTTAADGVFSFACSSGYYDASISLRDRVAEVVSPGQVNAGVSYFNESNGAAPSLTAANDFAAHAFVLLNQYVPVAEGRFGYSRGRVPVIVHPTDSTFAINYNQTQDTIRLNYTRIFTQDGRFVTIHEYGHAFQYAAIEPWKNYYCNPTGEHYIDRQYTFSCAFVEGFATFFSVWVAGDSLTNTYYSDYTIENQTFYSGHDGAQVEGAVAGFLYDFVDNTSSPDGPNNETGSDESAFDGVGYPGSFMANLLHNCVVTNGTTSYTQFDGIDELVYCMEGNTTANQAAASLGYNSWLPATGVTRNATVPTGYSTDAVRRLWRHNFYGQ